MLDDIVRSDGGQIATRGFLAQTLVCLLDMLRDQTWTEVTLEPNVDSEKVDILWRYADGTSKAVQVKSSANQISLASAKGWEQELIAWREADSHELLLVGSCAQTVIDGWAGQRVSIPPPQPLNFDTLIDAAAQRLGEYLEGRNRPVAHSLAKWLILAIIAKLLQRSTNGSPTRREDFLAEFESWSGRTVSEQKENIALEMFDELSEMLPGQFESVLIYVDVKMGQLPGKVASQAERAAALVSWAKQKNKLKELADAIERSNRP